MPATRTEPAVPTALLEQLELDPNLGRLADAIAEPVGMVLGKGRLSAALRGRGLGHALHPLLVQIPLGALLSAIVLDATQGSSAQRQSRLLTGLSLLSALPAAAAGLAEWAVADERSQRVGVVHAGLNLAAMVTVGASWLARRSGWSPAAAALTGLAGLIVSAGGVFGGHLSLVRKYASHDRPSNMAGAFSGRYDI